MMDDHRLFNHWVLTDKRDDGLMIYKHKETTLDGKQKIESDGWELKPDGKLVRYELSLAGSPIHYNGKYKIDGNTLYTYFENHYRDSLYKIVELNDNVLKII